DELLARARTQSMQLSRDQLLAGPTFAHNQNRAWDRCNTSDVILQFSHRWTLTAQCAVARQILPKVRYFGAQPSLFDCGLNFVNDPLHRFRFVDEAVCAESDRLDATIEIAGARVNDDRHAHFSFTHGAQHFEAIHTGHFKIEDYAIDRLAGEKVEPRR